MSKERALDCIKLHKCLTPTAAARCAGVSASTAQLILLELYAYKLLTRYRVGVVSVYCMPGADKKTAVEAALKAASLVPKRIRERLLKLLRGARSSIVYLRLSKILDERPNPFQAAAVHEYLRLLLDGAIVEESWGSRRVVLVVDREKALQKCSKEQ
jgi:hypothetical protein